MPAYIVETTDESPQVLILSRQDPVVIELQEKILEKGLLFETINLDEVSLEENAKSLVRLRQKKYYKILWWVGELSEISQQAFQILEFLQSREEKIVISGSVLPEIELFGVNGDGWKDLLAAQKTNIEQLVKNVPVGNFYFFESLVGDRADFFTRLIYAGVTSNKHFLLEGKFSAFTRKEVSQYLAKSIVKLDGRWGRELLINAPVDNEEIQAILQENGFSEIDLEKNARSLFWNDWEKKEIKTGQGKSRFLFEVKQWGKPLVETKNQKKDHQKEKNASSQEVRKEELEKKIAPLSPPKPPIWSPEIQKELEQLLLMRKPRVAGSFPPTIENRQKKYELQRTQKTFQYQQIQKIPKRNTAQQINNKKTDAEKIYEVVSDVSEGVLDTKISQVFGQERKRTRVISQVVKVEQVKKIVKKNKRQGKFIVFLGVGIGLFCFLSTLFILFFLNKLLVQQSIVQLVDQKTTSTSELFSQSKNLETYSLGLSTQVLSWKVLLGQNSLEESKSLAEVGSALANVLLGQAQTRDLLKNSWTEIFTSSGKNAFSETARLVEKTDDIYKNLSFIQAKLQNVRLSEGLQQKLQLFNDQIQEKRKVLAITKQLEESLPFLLGQESKKTYVLVLQNNLELRPTGGVVQALELVTFQNGTLINTQQLNPVLLDRNFEGQVTPPTDLQQIMGQKRLSLRDATWSGDFPSVSKQLTYLLEKSLGQKIDGVVALNLLSLKDLIRATGPLTISQYQEVLTDKNILEKVMFHSELALTSSASPDYLSIVLDQLVQKITTSQTEKIQAILDSFYTSFKNNQAIVSLADPTYSSLFTGVGWDGSVLSPNCPAQFIEDKGGCVVDSILQVDSNVGVNRANFYVERKVSHQVQVSQARVFHSRTIDYKNVATSNSWPAGEYKNYIRFYLPTAATNISAQINNQLISPTNIIESSEFGKKVVGFLISVPVQQEAVVKLQYEEDLGQITPFAYTFFNQNQSGTTDKNLEIVFQPLAGLRAVYIAPQAQVNGSDIVFQPSSDKHAFVGVKFR